MYRAHMHCIVYIVYVTHPMMHRARSYLFTFNYHDQVMSTADLLNVPIHLTDRMADEQRDGYIELLPYRQTFENVWRKLVSRSTQVIPCTRHNEAQTGPSISANTWFQYLYEYETVDLSTYTEDKIDFLKDFLRRCTDEMCDQVMLQPLQLGIYSKHNIRI